MAKFKPSTISSALRLPLAIVKRALTHPASVPVDVRTQVLNFAFKQGDETIQQRCPTQLIVVVRKKDAQYALEVYKNLARWYTDITVQLVRCEDVDSTWSQISALCAYTPSSIVVLGDMQRSLIDYLSTLNNHVLYVFGSSVPPAQKLKIDYFGGTVILADKLRKKGFTPYFACNMQKTEDTREKLLGFLSTIHFLDGSVSKKFILNLDGGIPNEDELPENAAIITTDYETAQNLREGLKKTVVACIQLAVRVPNTADILFSTVLPNELAADIINAFNSLYEGKHDPNNSIKMLPRFL